MSHAHIHSESSKVVMEMKSTALQTIDFALDMMSDLQCKFVFEAFAKWQSSPERKALW